MEGILLLLSPLILFAFIYGVGVLGLWLFTGQTPKGYAYNKEVKHRSEMVERGMLDAQLNQAAAQRVRNRYSR